VTFPPWASPSRYREISARGVASSTTDHFDRGALNGAQHAVEALAGFLHAVEDRNDDVDQARVPIRLGCRVACGPRRQALALQ
jgi:hypothetical protein